MHKRARLVAAAVLLLMPAMARAQPQENAPPPATIDPRDAADRRPSLVEPDFTLVNLPTTLRLPRYKSAFRIAHRFTRTLNNPDFGALAGNLFGLDNGALIGLEYRFGLMRGLQTGIYRTSSKTIQLFGRRRAPLTDHRRPGRVLPSAVLRLPLQYVQYGWMPRTHGARP